MLKSFALATCVLAGAPSGALAAPGQEPQELRAPSRRPERRAVLAADRLAGVALDELGQPLVHCFLAAQSEARIRARDGTRRSIGTVERARSRQAWCPTGVRDGARTLTDSRGRFVIEGLEPGDYRVFVLPRHLLAGARELTTEPVRAGTRDLRLSLRTPRLVVEVRDEAGRPRPVRHPMDELEPRKGRAERGVQVSCFENGTPWRNVIWPAEVALGRAVFDVRPGRSYTCVMEWPGGRDRTVVAIPHGAPRTHRTIVTPDAARTGALSVTVRDPDGRLYEWDNQVYVHHPDGTLATRFSRQHGGPTFQCVLLPGAYLVRVEANWSTPSCITGWSPEPALFAPVEAKCEVRLTLDLPGPALDDELRRALGPAERDVERTVQLFELFAREEGGPAARAWLKRAGDREPIALRFYFPLEWTHVHRAAILPGTTGLSHTLVAPGRYVLVVQAPGYRAEEVALEIQDRRETAVVVPLRERTR